MSVWSSLRAAAGAAGRAAGAGVGAAAAGGSRAKFSVSAIALSGAPGNSFRITPSRWQWHKFKDMLHYYVVVGAIPATLIILYSNIFIGPAELTPIPENYTPKYWEYERHPITRFIYRYIMHSAQQDYEKYLHYLYEENEKALLRQLEAQIKLKMGERGDYQAYYYRPVTAKYIRAFKESHEETVNRIGDD
ncbi:NADH dehydrogenase (ubiquinone) SGDH subunit [Arctopsyche grandis]|uniref:NADH dehydrogenase (ubiquinone) SGDH subunit n=1 Tax=Arctopsyche grandis TaxID=121162 RepID=UPI00406D7A32